MSSSLTFHIWTFHRKALDDFHLLPETNQKRVNLKIVVAIALNIIMLSFAIYFWVSSKVEKYADASAYSVSFIVCFVWLIDLLRFHRQKPIENEEHQNPSQFVTVNANNDVAFDTIEENRDNAMPEEEHIVGNNVQEADENV